MAGVIQVGGLATGLDTGKIIDQLMQLERKPLDLLNQQLAGVQGSQTSLATLGAKLAALGSAANALNTTEEVLLGKADSSNGAVVSAAAGAGAGRGATALTVTQLARGSVAGSTTGVTARTSTVALGVGTFRFQVGSDPVQSVALTDATTLDDLVKAINGLDAPVTASAVNLGTAAAPDYRLNLVSRDTGASSTITVVQDDTTLAVQATQAGQNAQFTVGGFSGSFERESNTFSDVLPGVTFSLKGTGDAVVTVNDDADAITTKVTALVAAFNDVVQFVAGESTVTQNQAQGDVKVGNLAADSTVRRLIDQLHDAFSETLAGATGRYVNLSSLGLATQKDGTISFDETKFRTALGDDSEAAAQVLAGNSAGRGVANGLAKLVSDATGIGGILALDGNNLDDQVRGLQDQIDAGQRRVDAVQVGLQAQFAALEILVSGLQRQSAFLTSVFPKA